MYLQRPKIEYYNDQVLIITRMVMMDPNANEEDPHFTSEQLSFVLGKNYLLTVQEELDQDCLDPVRTPNSSKCRSHPTRRCRLSGLRLARRGD